MPMNLFCRRRQKFLWVLLAFGVMLGFPASAQYSNTNGIFAEFNTSMGSYTCVLYYAQAPKTVANFIGLATGQRAWLDANSGLVRTNPLYNGVIFHRVIAGFMNQSGSPTGIGTGGPGYQFRDEFSPALRHDAFGVLSMANSGPDSNGSQFFITVYPQPLLNDVHSVFGRLYGGSNVVYAINHVATDSNDRPLTNVVLNSVVIRRVGAAAQAFDITTNALPLAANLKLKISRSSGSVVSLASTNRQNVHNFYFTSTNLSGWTNSYDSLVTSGNVSSPLPWTARLSREFFQLAQIQYPTSLFVPPGVANQTLTLSFDAGNGTFVINFDSLGGGTYSWNLGSPSTVYGYYWVQDPYRGRFLPLILNGNGGIPPLNLHLNYTSATGGNFKGTAMPYYPSGFGSFAVSGTFTSTP